MDDTPGLLYAQVTPNDWPGFDDWYNTEHGPLRVGIDFIKSGYRYKLTHSDPPVDRAPYLAMYEVTKLKGFNEKEYQDLTAKRSKREDDVYKYQKINTDRRFYKLVRDEGSSTGPAPVIMTVAFVMTDDLVDEFNRWYDEEHVDDVKKIPGWRRCRRYLNVGTAYLQNGNLVDQTMPKGHHEYIAIHEFDKENGLGGPYHEQSMNTPWRLKMVDAVKSRDAKRWEFFHEFKAEDYVEPK